MFSYTSVRECRLSCGLNSLGNNSNACKTYTFSYTSEHECRLSCGLSSFGSNSSACKTYVFSYISVHECHLSCGLSSVGSNSNACKTYVFSYTSVQECRLSCGLGYRDILVSLFWKLNIPLTGQSGEYSNFQIVWGCDNSTVGIKCCGIMPVPA